MHKPYQAKKRFLGLQFDHFLGDDKEVIAAVTDQYPGNYLFVSHK